eukprot:s1650_g1.t1
MFIRDIGIELILLLVVTARNIEMNYVAWIGCMNALRNCSVQTNAQALEEATKSRAELQEAMLKMRAELSEREERLRQRELLAADRLQAKEIELEKKAVEWKETAQRMIDEERQQ